jgi:hypothetical protein
MDSAFATNVKKKSAKSIAPKITKRTSASAVPNTLLNGLGAPSASLGINGDFYIDTLSMNIYGPKKKNAWPVPKSLVGPQGIAGAAGISGKQGVNGKDGKDGKDGVSGKDGERGAAGSSSGGAGVAGPVGPAGPAGAAGVVGPAGAPGPTGATGAQGLPGASGSTGATGLTGSTGAPGSQGVQGIQGVDGNVGPSRLIHGNTLGLTLSTSSAGTGITSQAVVTYQANKKYSFVVRQYGQISITQKTKFFGMDVFATNSADLKYSVVISEAYTYRGTVSQHEYIFEAIGSFSTTDNSGELSFAIIDGGGITASSSMTLSGSYQLIEVGDLTRLDQTNPVSQIS